MVDIMKILLACALAILASTVSVFTVIVVAAWLMGGIAFAHDSGPLKGWFNSLSSKSGGMCCSQADGQVVEDPDWETKDGHFRVKLSRNPGTPAEWVDVPDDAVLTQPNLADRTMVWPMYGYLGVTVRCFIPGSMT